MGMFKPRQSLMEISQEDIRATPVDDLLDLHERIVGILVEKLGGELSDLADLPKIDLSELCPRSP